VLPTTLAEYSWRASLISKLQTGARSTAQSCASCGLRKLEEN
jgi:hypothetical protein